MSIKHLALVAVCALTAFVANAAANFYWTSAEGDFSDASKWHKGTYNGATGELPGAENTCYLWGTSCTVRVDGEYRIGALWTNSGATGKTNVYALVGSGKLRLGTTDSGATSFQVATRTVLTMDGPDIYTDNGVQYCEGGTLVVKQGTYTPRTHYLKLAPGRLVIDGGTVTSYDETSGTHSTGRQIIMQNGWNTTGEPPPLCFIDLKSGVLECRCGFNVGTFTMTGGVWDRTKVAQGNLIHQFSTNLILDIQGGERIAVSSAEVPRNDTNFFNVAELEGGYPASKWRPISADGKYRFGSITTPMLFFISNNVELTGQALDVSSYQLATGACNVVMDIGTIKADTTTMLTVYTEHRPINLYSPKVVRFEAHGAGTMRILSIANTDVLWRFGKGIDVCTTAINGGGAANFRFGNPCFDEGATVDFAGVGDGTLYFANYAPPGGNANGRSGFSNLLSRVSMSGGKLTLENWAYVNNGYPFQTERFVLGPGAKFNTQFATYAHFDANEVEMDASNEIILTKPENGASNYFPPSPVTIGPKHVNDFQTAATQPTVTWATAGMEDDWNFEWINGMPVVWRKNGDQRATCGMTRTKMSKWRGTEDGDWFNSANWLIDTGKVQADDPLEQAMVFDGGYTNTRITVNSTAKAYQIRVYDKTAPVAFVGEGEIELGSNDRTSQAATVADVNAAIVSTSDNPLTFDVPVRLSSDISGNRYFTINQASRSYVAFMKELDGGAVATFKGDVRIGGAATADNFVFNAQANGLPKRRTRLWVIPGGSVTAKKQTWLQSGGDISIFISSNATFMVKDSRSDDCFWGYNDTRPPIRVKAFGKFDCHAPLGGSAPVAFKGEGEVRLADTGSRATADYPVSFDGVTFAVDAFTAGHPIALAGSPTWAATTDWSYDLGALSLPAGETLTVDTGDLDTGDGHATAIDSALTADALVKTGAGSLTLGSSANVLGDVRVEAGTLALGASQAFNSLSFAPGTTLRIAAAGATLAVAESLDLSNVTITLTGAARTALGNAWTTVLTVPEGQTFVGLPTMADANCAVRIVETETGFALQLRNKPGTVVTIR